MGFDINEARAIVEEAKKRGLIRSADAKAQATAPGQEAAEKAGESEIGHLPDWLQKSIREPDATQESA